MLGDVVGSVVFEQVARDAHYRVVARRLYQAAVADMTARHTENGKELADRELRNAVQEFEGVDPAVRLDTLNQQLAEAKTQGLCPCCGEEPCPEHQTSDVQVASIGGSEHESGL